MRSLIAADGGWLNITDATWKEWGKKFPGLDLEAELKKANRWLERHPSRMWKTVRGFHDWLERSYENKKDSFKNETVGYSESKHYAVVADNTHELPIEGKRASEEAVSALLRRLMSTLVEDGLPEIDAPRGPCEHAWRPAHYVWEHWCPKCGIYLNQMSDNFDNLIAKARGRCG